ncbi:MAG: arginase [Pseudomonadota bacterium]
MTNCLLIGAPLDCGKRRPGCLMGPDALRTAGLGAALSGLGHSATDLGNVTPAATTPMETGHIHALAETIAWTEALAAAGAEALPRGLPIWMGGDHALSLGTGLGSIRHAQAEGRPVFFLWLDAHADYHTPQTSESGNLHGTPLGYLAGRPGFDGFPDNPAPVPLSHVCLVGLRSVDAPERAALAASEATLIDMRTIDEHGIARPLRGFLDRVAAANGHLHVSLDVDFLDPAVAPAVGTTVPGGATIREGHLAMEMIHDSGLMTALDVVELNPALDERGRTAKALVDLVASGLGRRVFDRPTPSFL